MEEKNQQILKQQIKEIFTKTLQVYYIKNKIIINKKDYYEWK